MSLDSLNSCPSANNQSDVVNPLQVTGFELLISRLPEVSFFVKDVTLPSISLAPAEQVTPFVNVPRPGDKIQYSPLNVRIMVDEELKNYKALFDWITEIGFKDNWKQVNQWRSRQGDIRSKSSDKDLLLMSDATLAIKGQNLKTAAKFNIKDMWISDLGSLNLSDESTETQYLYCDVTFYIRTFNFDPGSVEVTVDG